MSGLRKMLPENIVCGLGIPLIPPNPPQQGSLYVDTSTGISHVYSGTQWEVINSKTNDFSNGFNVFDPDMMLEYINELGDL